MTWASRVPDDNCQSSDLIMWTLPKASVPKLSIVTQPTASIARAAADNLIERLESRPVNEKADEDADGERMTVTVTLKTGFVEGRSVKTMNN